MKPFRRLDVDVETRSVITGRATVNARRNVHVLYIFRRWSNRGTSVWNVDGHAIPSLIIWCTLTQLYAGLAIADSLRSARSYACSYSYAKKGMYRAFNEVFGKVGRVASPDVVVHLVKTKCLSVLYYAIKVCPTKSDVLSLQYVIDTCFKKYLT